MGGITFKGPAGGTQPANRTLRLEKLYADNDHEKVPTLLGIGPTPTTTPVGTMNSGFTGYLMHAFVWIIYVHSYSGSVDQGTLRPVLTAWHGGNVNDPSAHEIYLTPQAQPGSDRYGFNVQSMGHNGDYGHPDGHMKEAYLVEYNYPAGGGGPNVDRTKVWLTRMAQPPTWLYDYQQPAWNIGSWQCYVEIAGEWYLNFSASDHLVPPFCAKWRVPTQGYALLPAGQGSAERFWKDCETPAPVRPGDISKVLPYYLGGGGLFLLLASFFFGKAEASAANAVRGISVILIASGAALAVALDITPPS